MAIIVLVGKVLQEIEGKRHVGLGVGGRSGKDSWGERGHLNETTQLWALQAEGTVCVQAQRHDCPRAHGRRSSQGGWNVRFVLGPLGGGDVAGAASRGLKSRHEFWDGI